MSSGELNSPHSQSKIRMRLIYPMYRSCNQSFLSIPRKLLVFFVYCVRSPTSCCWSLYVSSSTLATHQIGNLYRFSSTFATYRKQFIHVITNIVHTTPIVHTNITVVEVFSLSTASDCERCVAEAAI